MKVDQDVTSEEANEGCASLTLDPESPDASSQAISPLATGRRLLTNAASSWLMYISQLLAAFVVSPIMVRSLGDARYGIWSIVESALAYLALFDLGVGASVVRHVAR